MKGWRLKRAINQPFRKPTASAHRERNGDRSRKRHLRLQAGREQASKGQHRTDRKIDAAGQDDHQHAETEEAVGDELARNVDKVALGQERIGHHCREGDDEKDRRSEEEVGAAEALKQGQLPGIGACRQDLGQLSRSSRASPAWRPAA